MSRMRQPPCATAALWPPEAEIAEDGILAARSRGVHQIVVLGAGLDTTGLRHCDSSFRVFEVDKPEMQVWKRQHLSRIGIVPPSSLVFVPVDFERDTLAAVPEKVGDGADEACFLRVAWRRLLPHH